MTSDHKPVKSGFKVACRPKTEPLPTLQPSGAPDIWISNLEGKGKIIVADTSGSSDPYIFFYCPEIGLTMDTMLKTHVQPQTLEPTWGDDEIPVLPLMTADKEILRGAHLMICMQDWDRTNADDDMGYATLPLAPFVDAEEGAFEVSLDWNGTQAGWLKGNIHFKWPTDKGVRVTRGMKSQGCICNCAVM